MFGDKERTKSDDFGAGIAAMIILINVVALFTSVGERGDPNDVFTFWDAVIGFVILGVLASCVIDLYKYVKRLP